MEAFRADEKIFADMKVKGDDGDPASDAQVEKALKELLKSDRENLMRFANVVKKALQDDGEAWKSLKGPPGKPGNNGTNGKNGSDAKFPKGAVVAFDRSNGCLEGWIDIGSTLRGHAIVAAVGDPDDEYGFGKTGGEKEVTLVINQIPDHRHKYFAHGQSKLDGNSDEIHISDVGFISFSKKPRRREENPGGTKNDILELAPNKRYNELIIPKEHSSHNNMPPFVALYFCKKN